MARMHTRRRGKSGSTRPYRTSPPDWIELNQEEVEDIIVKLAKRGEPPSKIGIILRDQYGIPLSRYVTGKKLTRTLEEKGIRYDIPEDLMNLIRKAVTIDRHRREHKKDMVAKRAQQLVEAKIRRLVKYYKREGRLPADWKYSIDMAKLLVR
ncbi:30S ribosomal protein S15 [Candidatus Pyrohabitans sp.]